MNDRALDVGVPLLSATQVTTFDACVRKWALGSIAKLPRKSSAAADLGTEIDATQLQPYLRDGKPLDFTRKSGDIARTILAHLPPAGSCKGPSIGREMSAGVESTVQKRIVLPSPTKKWAYLGFIDLWTPGPPPVVVDFKSTKDIAAYAKTETELATDVQAQLYATWALWVTKSDVADLAWLYMQTQGTRKSKRVHLRVTSAHAAEQFESIEERAARMVAIRESIGQGEQPALVERILRDLPPTTSACGDFGGCPFLHVCNLSPAEHVDALERQALGELLPETLTVDEAPTMSNPTVNLLAQLRGQAAPAPAPQAAPAPFQASGIPGFPAAPIAPAPFQASGIPGFPAAPIAQPAPQQPALGINPPESTLPPAPAVGALPAAPAPAAEAPKRGRPKKDPAGADMHAATSGAFVETETGEIVKLVKALRAGCDAFLSVMGAS